MQTATLSRAEIEAHDPEGGRGGRWLCPMPECAEHTDPRRHRSLSLVPETGLWHCHRCHAQGQVKEAWKDFKPKSKQERNTDALQRRRVGLTKILAKVAGGETSTEDQKSAPAGLRYRFGSLSRLETSRAALDYLATRGLSSPEALQLLTCSGVRFAPDFGRKEAEEGKPAGKGTPSVVFPLRDACGKLIASQGRFLKPWASGQKFHTLGDKNAGTFATAGALESFQKGAAVALVEAPFDALSLALAGLPALALCGSGGVPDWLTRRAFGRRFVLAFDADPAGDMAAEKIGEALRALGGQVVRLRPEGAKDFNELLQIAGAEALRDFLSREAIAPIVQGEPVGAAEGQQKRAEKGRHEDAARALPLAVAALYPDDRQLIIDWAWGEIRAERFPEPSEPLQLYSGDSTGDSAAVWFARAHARALALLSEPECPRRAEFLLLRNDMKQVALWAGDWVRWDRLTITHAGACSPLRQPGQGITPAMVTE